MTLDDFNKDIVKPMVERFAERRGKTVEELSAEYESELKTHYRVMAWARGEGWN